MDVNIRILLQNLDSLSSFIVYDLWNHIKNGHTTIIILVSIAILLSVFTIIRQQKILRKLDELTKQTPQISEKGDNGHAE